MWAGLAAVGRQREGRYDLRRTTVVSGSPRSGTTWLMGLVAAATGAVPVDEPDRPVPEGMVARYLGYRLDWRTFVPADLEDPPFTQALARILAGAYLRPDSVARHPSVLARLARGAPLVTKFVRANLFLPYLHARFPENRVVQIVRNPYAVVASQLSAPGAAWSRVRRVEPFYQPVIHAHPELAPPPGLIHPEAVLAAHWCIEQAVLERNRDRLRDVHLVRYEDLYRDTEASLRAVVAYLDRPWDPGLTARAGALTSNVKPGSALLSRGDPTTNYRRLLSENQQRRIGEVLAWFGHPFYRPSGTASPDATRS